MMQRNTWWMLVVGAAMVLGLSGLHFEGKQTEPIVSLDEPTAQPTQPMPLSASAATPHRQTPSVVKQPTKPRIDPEKVRAALASLNELQHSISQQQLDNERDLMAAKAQEFARVETPEPKHTPLTDASGHRWVKLEYPSGEVRYEFPTD
jgi:hypothetical protein